MTASQLFQLMLVACTQKCRQYTSLALFLTQPYINLSLAHTYILSPTHSLSRTLISQQSCNSLPTSLYTTRRIVPGSFPHQFGGPRRGQDAGGVYFGRWVLCVCKMSFLGHHDDNYLLCLYWRLNCWDFVCTYKISAHTVQSGWRSSLWMCLKHESIG